MAGRDVTSCGLDDQGTTGADPAAGAAGPRWPAGPAAGRHGGLRGGYEAATLLILRASDLLAPDHGESAAAQLALVLYAVFNLAATLISLPAGHLADRRGARLVLGAGVGLFLLAYLGFAATGANLPSLAGCFVAAGVAIGCVETAEHAVIAVAAPARLRGSAFGLLAAIQSFGNLAASAIAGLLWSAVSPRAAFAYLASWMALALAGLAFARETIQAGT